MEPTILRVREVLCLRDIYQDDEGRYFYDWRTFDAEDVGYIELKNAEAKAILEAICAQYDVADKDAYCKEKYPGSWEVYDGDHKPLYKINVW